MSFPESHIIDAHSLLADGRMMLIEILPLAGGTIRVKPDATLTWLGKTFEGVPMSLSGHKRSATGEVPLPKLTFGQTQGINYGALKGLIHNQALEDAQVIIYWALLDNLLNNRDIKETTYYRVRRVEGYSRYQITLQLGAATSALRRTVPHRSYVTPDFPYVTI